MKVCENSAWDKLRADYLYCYEQALVVAGEIVFLKRPVMNIAVNKIDIWRVRYHYSRDCVTIVPFHKDFSPSDEQLELRKLAHES